MGSLAPVFLEQVEQALLARVTPESTVAGPSALISRIARHLTGARGAHRVRPLTVQVVGTSLGAAPERLVDLAVAAEMIHTASLFHDDVVDEGTERRGIPTANARFGNAAAVLAGDWVLARAFGTLQSYPNALTVYAVDLVAEMSIGALGEVEARGRWTLTPQEWTWLAERKCGLLFGFAARAAALVAGKGELAPVLHEQFTRLGVAFQKADDLKDVLDGGSGKNRFADLTNQNPSWAIAHAVQASPAFGRSLAAAWAEGQPQPPLQKELTALCQPLVAPLEAELGAVAADVSNLLGPSSEPALQAFLAHTWGHLPRKAVA
jgi:geranylgeranyl pyrophosphate synthase